MTPGNNGTHIPVQYGFDGVGTQSSLDYPHTMVSMTATK